MLGLVPHHQPTTEKIDKERVYVNPTFITQ
jgi:hypothetical protein